MLQIARSQMTMYQSWCWMYHGQDGWEASVRRFVRNSRAMGLTRFEVRCERTTIAIKAMRPDAEWEDVA